MTAERDWRMLARLIERLRADVEADENIDPTDGKELLDALHRAQLGHAQARSDVVKMRQDRDEWAAVVKVARAELVTASRIIETLEAVRDKLELEREKIRERGKHWMDFAVIAENCLREAVPILRRLRGYSMEAHRLCGDFCAHNEAAVLITKIETLLDRRLSTGGSIGSDSGTPGQDRVSTQEVERDDRAAAIQWSVRETERRDDPGVRPWRDGWSNEPEMPRGATVDRAGPAAPDEPVCGPGIRDPERGAPAPTVSAPGDSPAAPVMVACRPGVHISTRQGNACDCGAVKLYECAPAPAPRMVSGDFTHDLLGSWLHEDRSPVPWGMLVPTIKDLGLGHRCATPDCVWVRAHAWYCSFPRPNPDNPGANDLCQCTDGFKAEQAALLALPCFYPK